MGSGLFVPRTSHCHASGRPEKWHQDRGGRHLVRDNKWLHDVGVESQVFGSTLRTLDSGCEFEAPRLDAKK